MTYDGGLPPQKTNGRRRKLLFILTNVVSLGCLIWVLNGANLGELRHEITRLDWRWVTAAVVADILVYVWHGWRWRVLLVPVADVPIWDSLRAVYAGMFFNEVLPFRAGEVIRCFLLARKTGIPISVVLSSGLIERMFDGVWLIACLLVTAGFVPNLPPLVKDGAWGLCGLLVLVSVFLGVAMYWREQTLDALVRTPWLNWVHVLIKDLHLIGHSRYLYYAAMISLPYLLMQVIPIFALMQADDSLGGPSIRVAFAAMVILRFGSIVPQGPGNLGGFQFLTVLSLMLFGVPKPLAKRFSLILWAAITLPLVITGFVALVVTGTKMGELHREARGGLPAK